MTTLTIVARSATAKDKESIVRDVSDKHAVKVGGKSMGDFIFKEYDSWLEDPDDILMLLEPAPAEGDQNIQNPDTKLAFYGAHIFDNTSFLFGLRVNPGYLRQGLAKRIWRELVSKIVELQGADTMGRCTVTSTNSKMHALCASLGFKEVSRFRRYNLINEAFQNWSPTTDHSEYELKPCTEDEVAQCFELLQRHNPSSGGFHQTVKFSFIPITESVVRARAAEGRAFILQHRGSSIGAALLAHVTSFKQIGFGKTQFCGSIFSEKDHQTAFAEMIVEFVKRSVEGFEGIVGTFCVNEEYEAALVEAGFKRGTDTEMVLYEWSNQDLLERLP